MLRTVPTSVPRHCANTVCIVRQTVPRTVPRIVPRTVYCTKNCAKKCVHTVPTTVPTTTMLTVLRMVPRCWHSPTKRVTLAHFSTRKRQKNGYIRFFSYGPGLVNNIQSDPKAIKLTIYVILSKSSKQIGLWLPPFLDP